MKPSALPSLGDRRTNPQARLALVSLLSLSYHPTSTYLFLVFQFPIMLASLPECERPCPISAQNLGFAKALCT